MQSSPRRETVRTSQRRGQAISTLNAQATAHTKPRRPDIDTPSRPWRRAAWRLRLRRCSSCPLLWLSAPPLAGVVHHNVDLSRPAPGAPALAAHVALPMPALLPCPRQPCALSDAAGPRCRAPLSSPWRWRRSRSFRARSTLATTRMSGPQRCRAGACVHACVHASAIGTPPSSSPFHPPLLQLCSTSARPLVHLCSTPAPPLTQRLAPCRTSRLPRGRQRTVQTMALATLACAWAASVLVLMDWGDRWLLYPTPTLLGAVAG